MADVHHHLRVFLASPGDVQPERDRIARELELFNRRTGRHLKLAYEPWRWEKDGVPGFCEDVQDLINPDLDAADVVVFLCWKKLGTKTPRDDSGFAEEFNRTRARWKSTGQPEVLFYRCKRGFFPKADELEQFAKLDEFLRKVRDGVFMREFETEDELADLLHEHLSELAHRRVSGGTTTDAPRESCFGWSQYLRYLVKQHRYLSTPGVEGGTVKKLELDRLYVRLRLQGRAGLAPEKETKDKRGELMERQGALDLADVLPRTHLALVGQPGSGKTTVLRHLALRLARHHLGEDERAPAELGLPPGSVPRPIFLRLAEVADRLRKEGHLPGESVPMSAWESVLDEQLDAEGSARACLGEGEVLVLFDGLDEVSGVEDRRAIARAIRDLADRCPGDEEGGRPNRFVVTCRTRAWEEGQQLERFDEVELLDLDDAGIDDFVGRWCDALGDLLTEPDAHGEALRGALRSSASVRRIATNPLMLTMLAVLHHAEKSLPQQRALLYEKCVGHLVGSPQRSKHLAEWGGAEGVKRHLRRLAVAMQEAVVSEGRPRDSIKIDAAVDLLAESFTPRDAVKARRLLDDLEIHVGLLARSGVQLRFHHRTFQEFLYAWSVAGQAEPAKSLGDRARDPAWAEVVQLVAGILAGRGEEGVTRYLAGLAGDDSMSVAERAPHAAAAALCLGDLAEWELPESAVAPAQEALADVLPVLEDPNQEADLKTRVAVAEGLGRVKDPRLTEDQRWVTVPAGQFWRGAAPDDSEAYGDESPAGWVEISEFRIQRWAVTVDEYRRFVEEGDGYQQDAWWSDEGRQWRSEHEITLPDEWDAQLARSWNHPVVGVSFWEAEAYCAWLTSLTSGLGSVEVVRLPTEAEWEKAARGHDDAAERRRYPWGGEWKPELANHHETEPRGLKPVGCFPGGHGQLGTWDQAGNAWEWTVDGYPDGYPDYAGLPGPNPIAPAPRGVGRVVRGGSWILSSSRFLRVSYRSGFDAGSRYDYLGFRVVVSRRSQDP
ncbi:MAG: SUMF1/EgtB/PvdO family nonheme iron enzyme [Acidobacteriota bacterium]